jgi:hypothetical protein
MVIIECNNWGEFEAPTLNKAIDKMVQCLAQHNETSCNIENITIDDIVLSKATIEQVSYKIENKIQEWRRVAKIESEGLRRAQQESMEG